MPALDRSVSRNSFSSTIPWAVSEILKRVHTAMPGVVLAYDAATRRAQVRGALSLMLQEAAGGPVTFMDRAVIVDVPVCIPDGWPTSR